MCMQNGEKCQVEHCRNENQFVQLYTHDLVILVMKHPDKSNLG